MDNTKEYLDRMANKRVFLRTDKFNITAKVSKDEKEWHKVEVVDISTGGLLFRSKEAFEGGETVRFDLKIQPTVFISQTTLSIKTQGEVLGDRGEEGGLFSYAAKFAKIASSNHTELDILINMVFERYGFGG